MFTIRSLAFCFSVLMIGTLVPACSSDDEKSPPPSGAPAPSGSDAGGGAPVPPASFPAASATDLQATIDRVVGERVAPGVAVVVDHPTYGRWSGASGVASIEPSAALTAKHRFRAGSIMKMTVATAVLQLVEQKQRRLDDTLPALLPETITRRIKSADAISLRMLLNHTSGIPEFSDEAFDTQVFESPRHQWTLDEILARVEGQTPRFAPGAGWSYSNTNYTLLGEILTATTGKPWREVVRDKVVARAGLTDTSFPPVGDAECLGCSRGYELVGERLVDMTICDPSMAGAAGGAALVTTAADLATFLRALSKGALFDDPRTFETMRELVDAPAPEEAQTSYGLGIARFDAGGTVLFGHLGGTAGYQSFVFLHPDTGIVASGFMNRRGDLGGFILPVLEALGRIR